MNPTARKGCLKILLIVILCGAALLAGWKYLIRDAPPKPTLPPIIQKAGQ
ncbi:MAG: hypothetical protein ABIT76_03525 [Chthoniobacterales bacterium]